MSAADQMLPLIAAGDRSAFTYLLHSYGGLSMALARQMLDDPGDAQDAAQEAFLALWEAAPILPAATDGVHVVSFTHRCAAARSRALAATLDGYVLPGMPVVDPAWRTGKYADPDDVRQIAQAQTAVILLPARQQEVLALTFWGARTVPEAAELLGISDEQVIAHLRDALRSLNRLLSSGRPSSVPFHGTSLDPAATVPATIHAQVGAYVVDALNTQQTAAFEGHLPSCPACQWEVHSGRARLGIVVTALTPPRPLPDRLLLRIIDKACHIDQACPVSPPPAPAPTWLDVLKHQGRRLHRTGQP